MAGNYPLLIIIHLKNRDSCETGWFKDVPSPEYTVWIPDATDPMSIITPLSSHSHCFGGLMSLNYDATKVSY